MENRHTDNEPHLFYKPLRKLIGTPGDNEEPPFFQKISLIPVLAWIGLGADGLRSYGSEQHFCFRR